MSLYKNRYRIESARLNGYDYHRRGFYFVTICTKSRIHYLGTIENGIALLTDIGNIALRFWCDISTHFPHVRIDSVVVMPNHVHGILEIVEEWCGYNGGDNETQSLYKNHFEPQSGNLSSIIRGYKAGVTTYARKQNIQFSWQPRFYDHIIRNEREYHLIRNYIETNPEQWDYDRFR